MTSHLPLTIRNLIPRDIDWRYNLWLHVSGNRRVSVSYTELVEAAMSMWPTSEEFNRKMGLTEVASHAFSRDEDFGMCEDAYRDMVCRIKINRLVYYGASSEDIARVIGSSDIKGFEIFHVETYKKYFCDVAHLARAELMSAEQAFTPFGGAAAIEELPINLRKDMALAMVGGHVKMTDADVLDALLPLVTLNAITLTRGNPNNVNQWTKAVDQAARLLETRKKIGGSSGFKLDKDLVFEHTLSNNEDPVSVADIDFDESLDSGIIEKEIQE